MKGAVLKKRLVSRAILEVGLVVLAFSGTSSSQFQGQPSINGCTIKGVVSLSKKPLRSVWVIISQNGKEMDRSLTGDDGKYYITNLKDGVYDIIVERNKKQLCRRQVTLPRDSVFDLKIKSARSRKC